MSGRICEACDKPESLSSVVAVVLVFAPGQRKPYPLIPSSDYKVCKHDGCRAPLTFAELAVDSHPETRTRYADWFKVQIGFDDPNAEVWSVNARRAPSAQA